MRTILLSTLASLAFSASAWAGSIVTGTYVGLDMPGGCEAPEFDKTTITESTIRIGGGDVTCSVTNPVGVRDFDATLFDARCSDEAHPAKAVRLLFYRQGRAPGDLAGLIFPDRIIGLRTCAAK